MTMRKRAGTVLFTAAAAVALVGISVGPALAATSLKVKVSGGGSYTATAGKTVLSDNGVNVTCTKSSAKGTLKNGTYKGKAPVKLGTVSKLGFTSCSSILGPVTNQVVGTPVLNANSKTSTKGKTNGDTAAVITKVDVKVSLTGCSFTVTGSAPGYYSNKTHTLYMTPKPRVTGSARAGLVVSKVNGCAGVVKNGDKPTYTASYKVSRKVVIKSS
ncbi:MAG TPA: hypothetical protein VMA32_16580 [Streptosporangiaceae bacterium]|nr:hypothetical protein [Streptosporangiaceae bacterium]